MKILLADTLNNGTTYYRMRMFLPALRELGHEATTLDWNPTRNYQASWETNPLAKTFRQHMGLLMATADVAVFQAVHSPDSWALVEACRKQYKKPVLAEVDDNFMNVDYDSPAHVAFKKGDLLPYIIHKQINNADGIITSTPYLQEFYRSQTSKPQNVHIVQNGVELKNWPLVDRPPNKKVIIGWQGGATHTKNLEMIAPAIDQIAGEMWTECQFVFVHGAPGAIKALAEKHKNTGAVQCPQEFVSVEDYPAFIRSYNFDIGLAPMFDSKFARSKSDLRFIEYSAQSIPTVASKCEAYKTISDGRTGLLANSISEWVALIRMLVRSPDKRQKLGEAARRYVEDNRTTLHSAKQYETALRGILDDTGTT